MEACRILEERSVKRIKDHGPSLTAPKIEGAVVAPNRDVIRTSGSEPTARARHDEIP
jgi:hypothetical protein